jgi:hypothetical protein
VQVSLYGFYIINMETRIAGIPCQIRVDYFYISEGSYSPRAETPDEYYGGQEIEFTVLDRKGYKASWLARKMTDEDTARIQNEIIKYYENDS